MKKEYKAVEAEISATEQWKQIADEEAKMKAQVEAKRVGLTNGIKSELAKQLMPACDSLKILLEIGVTDLWNDPIFKEITPILFAKGNKPDAKKPRADYQVANWLKAEGAKTAAEIAQKFSRFHCG